MAPAPQKTASRRIEGAGTPDADWQAWPRLGTLPRVTAQELVPDGARAVIVAPHPDDELLGCGGLLQLLAAQGRDILLVAVTDGTGSHPGSPLWPAERLSKVRPQETEAALDKLGLPDIPVVRAGLPDGDVAGHVPQLCKTLESLLRPGDVVFTTWKLDGHPDHDATGHAATTAAASRGATLIQIPIWAWHWASPDDMLVPWHRARRLDLREAVLRRKCEAIDCYQSQVRDDESTGKPAILPPNVLERLMHPYEIYLS
jgi:LmbE family N-acetylglucosaminyl deacetylase